MFVFKSFDDLIEAINRMVRITTAEKERVTLQRDKRFHMGQAAAYAEVLSMLKDYKTGLEGREETPQAPSSDPFGLEFNIIAVFNVPAGIEPEPTEFLFFTEAAATEAYKKLRESGLVRSLRLMKREILISE